MARACPSVPHNKFRYNSSSGNIEYVAMAHPFDIQQLLELTHYRYKVWSFPIRDLNLVRIRKRSILPMNGISRSDQSKRIL